MSTLTNEICDARMETLNTKISNIETDVKEMKADLKAALDLKGTVNDHDKFISGLKTWGLRVLVALAAIALTGGTIELADLLKP